MNKKVSIVIPTFNRSKLLVQTIECALSQSYPCEIIVSDHGSTDDTPEVIKKYIDRVKYIRKENDYGINFCWLDGVIQSTGEYIHIHLDDDLFESNYIERCMELFDDDIGFVFTDAIWKNFDPSANQYVENCLNLKNRFHGKGVVSREELEHEFLDHKFMLSPAACVYRRKDVIDALYPGDLPVDFGGKYKGVGPDHFMSLICLLRYQKFACIPESLVTFRVHDKSITIDASKDEVKARKIAMAYDAWRNYYLLLKSYKSKETKCKPVITSFLFSLVQRKVFYGLRSEWTICGIKFLDVHIENNKKNYFLFGAKIYSVNQVQK